MPCFFTYLQILGYNLAQENERYEIKTVSFKAKLFRQEILMTKDQPAGCMAKLANKQDLQEIIWILRDSKLRLNKSWQQQNFFGKCTHFIASLYCIRYYFCSYEDPSFKGLLWATAKYHAFDICWHIKFWQFCTLIFSI